MSFLALETYAVISIIAVVLVQYAFATFCLVKLAFLDVSKKEYVLWNVFILIVFFIGCIAFMIYWSKVKDKKRIPPLTEQITDAAPAASSDDVTEQSEQPEQSEPDKADENESVAPEQESEPETKDENA